MRLGRSRRSHSDLGLGSVETSDAGGTVVVARLSPRAWHEAASRPSSGSTPRGDRAPVVSSQGLNRYARARLDHRGHLGGHARRSRGIAAQRRGYHAAARREHGARMGCPRGAPRPAGATPTSTRDPPATLLARRGRVEREVVSAAEGMDILVLARDGDRQRLGPHSLGPATRFVIDHAPCRVLLIWPDVAPGLTTISQPPPPGAPPPLPPPPQSRPRG